MRVHLINPSHISFGIGVITPRWLYVLAGATPPEFGDPILHDETLEHIDFSRVQPGDVVGIGIHTGNAVRGYEVGRQAREHGATVVYGGIHATLYPEEAIERGGAHAVVIGDGEAVWPKVLTDCQANQVEQRYEAGWASRDEFVSARWDLMPTDRYMWASVQTVRGCPKHCSFCSVWRTDGQRPRQRHADRVIEEIVELRRKGFRFIALADDNFYPVTLDDVRHAESRNQHERAAELREIRDERFELMRRLAQLPKDMVFFTQITMETADDPEFLTAMRNANIRGALVGVESVTEEGLKAVFKGFNSAGSDLIDKLQTFRKHDVHVLGSFIFGLSTDRPDTFDATAELAQEAELTFAQFVTLTPFPGTVDFDKWEKDFGEDPPKVDGTPLTRYWLIPNHRRPKLFIPHPTMSVEEIRTRTLAVWHRFYTAAQIWKRSGCVKSLRGRLAFLLVSKLYLQMYANTGIATDSARVKRANVLARMIAMPLCKLFKATPMPDLRVPEAMPAPVLATTADE